MGFAAMLRDKFVACSLAGVAHGEPLCWCTRPIDPWLVASDGVTESSPVYLQVPNRRLFNHVSGRRRSTFMYSVPSVSCRGAPSLHSLSHRQPTTLSDKARQMHTLLNREPIRPRLR